MSSERTASSVSPGVLWLVLFAVVGGGFWSWQNVVERRAEQERQQELRDAMEAERQRRISENLEYLAEQAERQRCQEFVRTLGAATVAPRVGSQEAAMMDMVKIGRLIKDAGISAE